MSRVLVLGQHQREALALTDEALAIMSRPEWEGRSMQKARAEAARIQVLARIGLLQPDAALRGRCSADATNLDAEMRFALFLQCAQVAQLSGHDPEAERLRQAARQLAASHWPARTWRGALPALRAVEQALAQGQACGSTEVLTPFLTQVPRGEAALRADLWLAMALCEPARVDLLALQRDLSALPAGLEEVQALLQEALGRVQWAQGQIEASRRSLRAAVDWRRQQDAQRGGLWLARASDALAAVSPEPDRTAMQRDADADFAPWTGVLRAGLRARWRPRPPSALTVAVPASETLHWLARASDALAAVSPEPGRTAMQRDADADFAPWTGVLRAGLRARWRPRPPSALTVAVPASETLH